MDIMLSKGFRPTLIAVAVLASAANAGDLQITPSVSVDGTYSDNVELTANGKQSSYVNQVSAILDSQFTSRIAELNFNGSSTYASYTHNHDLDDSFRTLEADGRLFLWPDGLALTANANIRNGARNGARNSLADIVSGDTIEIRNFQSGLSYNVENLKYQLNLTSNISRQTSEDNIGDNNRIETTLTSQSTNSSQAIFWRINATYSDQENNEITGRQHIVDAIVGWRTPSKINPFIRFYNEDVSGNISQPQQNSGDATGVGISTKLSSHLLVSASYNFVVDDEENDDYVAATIEWEPSARTSLRAEYSKRFFGDTYLLDFTHRTKRLTNSVSYNESLRAFDRNTFQRVLVGNFFCPLDFETTSNSLTDCFQSQGATITPTDAQLVQVFEQQLIEGNEFSLNKELSWQSQLSLARTNFDLRFSHNRRESLTTNIEDNRFDATFEITRTISGKSTASLTYNFNHTQLDKNQIRSLGQDDYYRTLSISYNRRLARTLNSVISLQMVDRNSSDQLLTYEETRAVITLTKDF
ncbi:TIGR03016 family PEP-CTERM system-associated outer membrane protein [Endozoicomonas sp. G2_1]|uniref:TIGR03016 family PEP-CTERM system-associated outer membrane protein n=1 Tax=Endozoicomonas sp. G2_1 TaxID=2821091 RepID=UPI001ADAFA23|nr:TIGR03016 family PEP-CTERM system-associated outer membrane protein [Endozoicomonas sp. G2_1]MBO9490468.1 TIGR03016 family PEP-CTERM system-associated outer membrane protein [Endozoicomonas sp. G2_1]